ncbi:hypothetical protein GCM10007049_09760 [Echinicola pacifica]|uniref:Outer membrane protein beta-barrel domain-containing protein n=1 Tax=Echinicola pacifica TaxID=346377 RepID=A0A918PSW1_9BACT|nr:hypothetical protein [Echinicola pacifica]GGZ19405.1 hypothetical protein GCM10007049_09760 [Echinicola pacifica]
MKTLKKCALALLMLTAVYSTSLAQESPKNEISISPMYLHYSIHYSQGSNAYYNVYGVEVGYARSIAERLIVEARFGKGYLKGGGETIIFDLKEDEKDFLNYSTWKLGLGYNVINTEKLRLTPQFSFMRTSFTVVRGIFSDGDGTIVQRDVGSQIDISYLVGLKLWNRLGENVGLVTQIAYQPNIGGSEVFVASTGVSFSF